MFNQMVFFVKDNDDGIECGFVVAGEEPQNCASFAVIECRSELMSQLSYLESRVKRKWGRIANGALILDFDNQMYMAVTNSVTGGFRMVYESVDNFDDRSVFADEPVSYSVANTPQTLSLGISLLVEHVRSIYGDELDANDFNEYDNEGGFSEVG